MAVPGGARRRGLLQARGVMELRLQLEVESLSRQLLIALLVEAVEAGGAVGDALLDLVELFEEAHGEDLLAEVALVELLLEDDLVHALELRQRELGRQELEADGLVGELAAEAGERGAEDI